MGLLGKKERAKIDAMFADKKTSAEEILAYIAKWVIDRVAEGTFTEAEAEKDLEIELYMGRGLLVCREYEAIVKMLRMLTSCAEEGMNHSLWCYLKGMGHTYAGELEEAYRLISRSFELDSLTGHTRAALVRLLFYRGKKEKAEALLSESLELFPDTYELVAIRRDLSAGKGFIDMLFHYPDEEQDEALHRDVASADYDHFKIFLSTVLLDEEGLKRVRDAMELLGASLKPSMKDVRYLEGNYPVEVFDDLKIVPVTILSNEAGISHWSPQEMPRLLTFISQECPRFLANGEDKVSLEISLNGKVVIQVEKPGSDVLQNHVTMFNFAADKALTLREAQSRGEELPFEVQTVLEKCGKLNEEGKVQEVIDLLEAIPEETRSPLLTSELARAYNNIAYSEGKTEEESQAALRRALALLFSVRETENRKHSWQFRVGYAFYYLDREDEALPYFKRALALRPGDPDTVEFLHHCLRETSLPTPMPNFATRIKGFWDLFEKHTAALYTALKEADESHRAEITEMITEAVHRCFDTEWGVHVHVRDRILVEISPNDLFWNAILIGHICESTPEKLKDRWEFVNGIQAKPLSECEFRFDGKPVDIDKIRIWVNRTEEKDWKLSLFMPEFENLPQNMAREGFRFVNYLFSSIFGESVVLRWLRDIGIKRDALPRGESHEMTLTQFVQYFRETELKALAYTMEEYLYEPIKFSLKPHDSAYPLYDVADGETWCMMPLIGSYFGSDTTIMNHFREHGATAAMIGFGLNDETVAKTRNPQKAAEKIRERLVKYVKWKGPKCATLSGTAQGKHWTYAFFILWDPMKFAQIVEEFANLQSVPVKTMFFRSFYTFGNPIFLRRGDVGEAILEKEAEERREEALEEAAEERQKAAQEAAQKGQGEEAENLDWSAEDLDPNRVLS